MGENGRYICPECENYVDVDNWFPVDPVKQPDGDSCGWATTLWLLRSFGALDVTPAQLRRELNTDAQRGIRRLWNDSLVRKWIEDLGGWDLEAGKGTLPWAIYAALSRRGIALKNPAKGTDPEDWEGRCVTGYAATATREDFAETFMRFVKHKGKIPAKFAKMPPVRKKWKAVAEIVKRVASATR